jgi:hypothetical protein
LINELHSGNFTIQAYNANLLAISKFKNQEYYFSVDSTAGRLHTNLTGLKSELRQFVKYGGQQLVSVDVKNSQPFLSTLLLTKEFYQTTTPIPFSLDSLNSTMPKPIQFSNQTTTSLIMLVNNSEVPDNTNVSDISIYREKVITGTFYEYLGNQIEKKCDVRIDDRQQLKEMVFTVLYSDNRFIGGLKAWPKRLFRNTFPTVYKVFYHLKQKAHNTLAILLQSIESHFILDFVVKRIVSEKPNMPIFTIHDSVVCQVGNEEYIKTIIQEEAMKCFGVAPVLKIEFWNPTVNTS